jgi:hypothetical protein
MENNEQIQCKSNDNDSFHESLMSEEIGELAKALSSAQGEFDIAGKNAVNPFFKSNYADFESVIKASRPALSKHGLSVVQSPFVREDGNSYLITLLIHSSGQWIKSKARHNPAKNDIQSLSSYNTYLKRMCYSSLVGVATGEEDDDGEKSMAREEEKPKLDKVDYKRIGLHQASLIIGLLEGDVELEKDMLAGWRNLGWPVNEIRDLPLQYFDRIIEKIKENKQ